MSDIISASTEEIQSVAQALQTASSDYKTSLNKLTNLIQEISSGAIKGPVADDLQKKFEAKKNTFDNLKKVLDDAEDHMNREKSGFNSMVNDLKSGMK